MQQRSITAQFLRFLSVILSAAILVTLTSASAHAESTVDELVEVNSSTGDYGSGATEWSGATYNADRNVLFTVDDETGAYEFDLRANGSIDTDEPVRVMNIALGMSDFEGVAWISGERYALLSEDTGIAYIVDVPLNSNTISPSNIVWQFTAGGPDGNLGSEGIAIGSDGSFYVTDEKPSSVSQYTASGSFIGEVPLPQLLDATGVVVAQDDTLIVVSHESRVAVHYDVDFTAGTAAVLNTIDLSAFVQLEGVAMIGNEQLHFFGERKSGGKTHSQMVGTIISETFDPLDVNCSGHVDIADALYITLIETGVSPVIDGCGAGDSNGDGNTDVADALMIAQCQVGLSNSACPLP